MLLFLQHCSISLPFQSERAALSLVTVFKGSGEWLPAAVME